MAEDHYDWADEAAERLEEIQKRREQGGQSLLTSYLNCPFCPAQAYLTHGGTVNKVNMRQFGLRQYICPAKHKFLIEETFEGDYANSLL
jgi:hypothetical protein